METEITYGNNPRNRLIHPKSLGTRALQGAGIAFILLILFFTIGGDINPGSKAWILLPLITVTIGGAAGGIIYYLLDSLRYQGGRKKYLANLLSLLAYILFVMVTFVLGMNGPN
ncbi:potassium transporter KefB [Telluribacter sp.]|jgi:uncharacterized membrane protein YidH (DUF202 family)|uniref:potassium transporter KefB n=1 Tax=Telluribacter sp. TaxID=1978767 RepID=UPI002E13FA85|nr:potassium transporter KefB [Telluribacter sp.]